MLQQIKTFFVKQPIANLQQIADALHTDPDAVRGMLTGWMRKGCVRCLSHSDSNGCETGGGCNSCTTGCSTFTSAASRELYCWQAAIPA